MKTYGGVELRLHSPIRLHLWGNDHRYTLETKLGRSSVNPVIKVEKMLRPARHRTPILRSSVTVHWITVKRRWCGIRQERRTNDTMKWRKPVGGLAPPLNSAAPKLPGWNCINTQWCHYGNYQQSSLARRDVYPSLYLLHPSDRLVHHTLNTGAHSNHEVTWRQFRQETPHRTG